MRRLAHFALIFAALLLAAGCAAPEVGDPFGDGTIVSVWHQGGSCYLVQYELEPLWAGCEDAAQDLPETDLPSLSIEASLGAPTGLEEQSCGELVEIAREGLRLSQRTLIDAMYQSELRRCLPVVATGYLEHGREVEYCSGQAFFGGGPLDGVFSSEDGDLSAEGGDYADYDYSVVPPSVGEGASEYTTTNDQVSGVEEADYVKNDAGHVFVLTADSLRVFDTWPVADAHELARVPLADEPRRLLLAGDRLVVFSRLPERPPEGEEWASAAEDDVDGYDYYYYDEPPPSSPSDQGCTYGYECRYQSDGGRTRLQVFDVTEPSAPLLLASYEFESAYVAARRVEQAVHLVLHAAPRSPSYLLPGLSALRVGRSFEEHTEGYEALLARMNRLVDAMTDEQLLPPPSGDDGAQDPCQAALLAPGASGTSFVSLLTLDLDAPRAGLRGTVIASHPGYVYASSESLYLATDGADGWTYRDAASDSSTIHKFRLGSTQSTYAGSARLRGHVLNQFALDEYDGVLRVATTSGWVPDPGVSSTLTTLREVDGQLSRYGELTGLAPNEDIRSVRFVADRGFVVTFKKTDPLFALDLSRPASPFVLGELKIPGFSTYLHPLDRDHLLAVGFDSDDHGDFAYFDGILLQMFDVTDMSSPQLLHKTVIGTRGSGSEALLNHLAFNYFPARKQLAMPVTVCEGGDDGDFGGTMSFSGVMVFDVSIEDGIIERGRMPFADAAAAQSFDYGSSGCGQWWSSSTSTVKRSIFFEDYLVALSDAELRGAQVDALDDVLFTLPLVDGSTAPQPRAGY